MGGRGHFALLMVLVPGDNWNIPLGVVSARGWSAQTEMDAHCCIKCKFIKAWSSLPVRKSPWQAEFRKKPPSSKEW